MHVEAIRTPGLGDTSYLLSHQGHGLLIDPQLDVGRFLERIDAFEVRITHVLDTHVHNDYLSGAPALARRLDADLVMPAASGVAFAFVPAFHHEDLTGEGGLVIRPLHTPGHTPEHTSYLVLLDGEPWALFSGGSLLVGSAGRTDLLGDHLAESLARLQFGSVTRLAALPGSVGLYPTHGEGSFCTISGAGRETSTIAAERESNPVLRHPDVESFLRHELEGLLPYPRYYAHMAPLNRSGPEPVVARTPPELGARDLLEQIEQEAAVVDARSRHEYASGHLPGSLNIEHGDAFASWVGWMVPFGTPVILVVSSDQDPAAPAVDLGRIGFEVVGFVRDTAVLPKTTGSRLATVNDLARVLGTATVVDVRDPAEWRHGRLRDSVHRYVPDLLDGDVPDDGDVWLVCESGFRSSIAAGLVERAGGSPVIVTGGGVTDLLQRHPELAAG